MLTFLLDNNVDVAVGQMLRRHRHRVHTASELGAKDAADDELTVIATNHGGWVVVTHDREFSRRRQRLSMGRHLHLRCDEWRAVDLLEARLSGVVGILRHLDHVTLQVSEDGMSMQSNWARD